MRSPTLKRVLLTLAGAAFAAFLVTGCGDGETTTVTETTTAAAESDTSTESSTSTTTGEDTTTSTGSEDGGTPPADQEVTELTGFTSPTENIGCIIDRSSVRCDISDRSWNPPKAPASCDLDYGQGITLSAGAAPEFVCAGDTTLGSGPALEYGTSIASGLLRCESEESGITCTDAESGRGFTIAKESYEIF